MGRPPTAGRLSLWVLAGVGGLALGALGLLIASWFGWMVYGAALGVVFVSIVMLGSGRWMEWPPR